MNLQLFFDGFGTPEHFQKQIAVIEEDIRLLKDQRDAYALVPAIVRQIDADIEGLCECVRMLRTLIGTASQSMPVRQDQSERNSGSEDGQPVVAYTVMSSGRSMSPL